MNDQGFSLYFFLHSVTIVRMVKKVSEAYQFCPVCRGKFQTKESNLLICSACGFQYFINPRPCTVAIISDNDGKILLVKRKYDPKKGYWDLPGGFMEQGEDLDESVKREIREELGIEIEITGIVGGFADTYDYQNIVYPVFTTAVSAKITQGVPTPTDDVSEYAFFSKEDVLMQDIAFPSLQTAMNKYYQLRSVS